MMIYSFSPFGYEGALVTVEVDLRRGIPAVDVVGLADGAVRESRERVQVAVRNSGFDFPMERVLISLSPADLKKEGAGFDLPIALAVLVANAEALGESGFIKEPILVMGELELSGKIRPVKGVHAAVATASSFGISRCIVPDLNADEAREVSGVQVYGADRLENAFRALKDYSFYEAVDASGDNSFLPEGACNYDGVFFPSIGPGYEFGEIKGQGKLIRALQIAAGGGHNLLAYGAPGCGKTMAIQKFPSINPLLTLEEAQSVTRIWSLAGLIKPSEPLVRIPPFRMPHQTSSIEGICGGGVNCRPGEISLAHNGVLFLDEAAEFRSSVLQMLRVPIENGHITLCRAGRSTVYPAQFQLMMAVNPCPCGNYGSKSKICLCSAKSVEMYWKKFSGPLLDRIDLRVFVENDEDCKDGLCSERSMGEKEFVDLNQYSASDGISNSDKNLSLSGYFEGKKFSRRALMTTHEIRLAVARAVKIQRERQNEKNARLTAEGIAKFCILDEAGSRVLNAASERYGFSQRGIVSCMKVARTIADLEGSEKIKKIHMEEAVQFRKDCNNIVPE
ncbi:MAG: YifB family Mg chelatase-like AAA ATPase [Treponema sp.]|nr:YifB family Mg chelatase-like AAA ATPase [Treponema sp.]